LEHASRALQPCAIGRNSVENLVARDGAANWLQRIIAFLHWHAKCSAERQLSVSPTDAVLIGPLKLTNLVDVRRLQKPDVAMSLPEREAIAVQL